MGYLWPTVVGIQFKFVNEKKHYISNTYTVKSYVVVFFKELYSQNDYKKKKKKKKFFLKKFATIWLLPTTLPGTPVQNSNLLNLVGLSL